MDINFCVQLWNSTMELLLCSKMLSANDVKHWENIAIFLGGNFWEKEMVAQGFLYMILNCAYQMLC